MDDAPEANEAGWDYVPSRRQGSSAAEETYCEASKQLPAIGRQQRKIVKEEQISYKVQSIP